MAKDVPAVPVRYRRSAECGQRRIRVFVGVLQSQAGFLQIPLYFADHRLGRRQAGFGHQHGHVIQGGQLPHRPGQVFARYERRDVGALQRVLHQMGVDQGFSSISNAHDGHATPAAVFGQVLVAGVLPG